jgi:formylglycine-generating enzyme required for sulfatase activity
VHTRPHLHHPLAWGIPPLWAVEWGEDAYGPWCAFAVGEVTQRMRWIPPGRFLMGSPKTEEGRFEDEGPQHAVQIEPGFWMLETPCTQALWKAVMNTEPSHFSGDTRPVEQVSWNDCREFVKRLNGRVDGLDLGLPSEAQWEYACRAGCQGSRYHDNLDAIAWYGENSGGETHPVGEKLPNGWGLYDTLGNVNEWCADAWRENYSLQPRHTDDQAAHRVLRGGSWLGGARFVRAACRIFIPPAYRRDFVGFRCAEFREGRELSER